MKKGLILLMVICSLLGIADASYITWEKFQGVIPRCTTGFKCGDVLTSKWASIGPVPLSLLGVVFYTSFLILAMLTFLDITQLHIKTYHVSLHLLSLIWGIFGLLFSIYLITIMGVILNAWCLYCLLSALNCMILFSLSGSSFIFYQRSNHEN